MPRIAVLIPCFNEAVAIPGVIAGFRAALPDAAIHVYDNNSTDGTAALARAAGARIGRETRQGKGHVIRRMFADVEADIYILADGDGTYDAASAPALIAMLRAETLDMVTATRVEQAQAAYRRGHRFGNAVLTGLTARLFGARLGDMLSGYRVFSRRFVKSFPALSSGFETETELTVHALQLGMPAGEMPCPYRERPPGSTSKLRSVRDGMRILRLIVMLVKDERPIPFFSLGASGVVPGGISPGVARGSGIPARGPGAAAADRHPVGVPGHAVLPVDRLRADPGFGGARPPGMQAAAVSGHSRAASARCRPPRVSSAVTAGQSAAIWCLDGAWVVWLGVWVALSGRVKPVRRRESLPSRAAHLLPLVLAAFLLLYTGFGSFAGLGVLERPVLPRAAWTAYTGTAVTVAGLGLAIWARLVLAGNWSGTVTLKHDHALIQHGPYAWTRHPIYTGLLLAMSGTAIAMDELRGVLALAVITAAFLRKLRTEEAFMREAFGGAYDAYALRVGALVPRLPTPR